jgi:hypothetical protein
MVVVHPWGAVESKAVRDVDIASVPQSSSKCRCCNATGACVLGDVSLASGATE